MHCNLQKQEIVSCQAGNLIKFVKVAEINLFEKNEGIAILTLKTFRTR